MKIAQLFKGLPVQIKGNGSTSVSGISTHSQFISPGDLFIARHGERFNGNDFIIDAVQAGAAAVLTDLYNPFLTDLTQVIASNVGSLEPILANRYYRFPSRSLFLVGITGTNGKTTIAHLLYHLFHGVDHPCGLIGTVEYRVGEQRLPAVRTTPDIATNCKLLRKMIKLRTKMAVMEVSSHALDQNRVEGLDFNAAIFTNLSQDHLDYHQTMERYGRSKKKLFSYLLPQGWAIVNRDDPYHRSVVQHCQGRVVTYGIKHPAEVFAEIMSMTTQGSSFVVHFQKQKFLIRSPLIGEFNIYNALSVIALALLKGVKSEVIQKKMENFEGVAGRLEMVDNPRNIYLFVDYAHTEQGLRDVLVTLKQLYLGRLITVFGCGGDRDPTKRAKMAHVVESFSDQIVVTSDNVRSEDAGSIVQDIVKGFRNRPPLYSIELDRKRAILKGISMAGKGDVVLVAGRGHETFLDIGGSQIAFQDRWIMSECAHHFCSI